MSGCQQFADTIALLALDAAEASEADQAEAHVRGCSRCAGELDHLRAVAAELALGVPQHDPPPALGGRILRLARQDLAVREREAGASTEGSPRFAWLQRSSWSLGWTRGFAVASLAIALSSLLWAVSLQWQLADTRQQLGETTAQLERIRRGYWTVASVLAAPEVEISDLQADQAAPSAVGKVWVDPASGRGMMMARGLPALPNDRVYQVWLNNAQGRVAAGQLRPNEEGVYYVVLQAPDKLSDYERLGVTVEPAGSVTTGPTGPRVLSGEL